MKKTNTIFVCDSCGREYGKWQGKCEACGEWNRLKEFKSDRARSKISGERKGEIEKLGDWIENAKSEIYFTSKIGELDRVLGKGFTQGQVILLAGEPGIGKSTLLTQIIGKVGGLYVSGEESAAQVGERVRRLGLETRNVDILETNEIDTVEESLDRVKNEYKLVVVDSIQMMRCGEVDSWAGGVNQIRQSTFRLIQIAKQKKIAIIIVGHVTKGGDIAGPKLMEHMVDTVLYFEGERNKDFRIIRCRKNRFGPVDEIGVFVMEEGGLREVSGEEFSMIEGGDEKPGMTRSVIVEGNRTIGVEIQALVVESYGEVVKRVFSGIEYNRGQLIIAICQKHLGIPLYKYDVYVAVVGGVRVNDTAIDLAVASAIYGSYKNKIVGKGKYFVGELGLLGDVKKIRSVERKKKEVKRLGGEIVEIMDVREIKEL